MIFKETRIKSLSFAVRDSRFPHMCRAVPLSSSVFHTACALSAPAGHLPLEGKADDTRIPSSKKAAKPPPSFLIRAKLSFRGKGQHALWAPYPLYLISQNRSVFSFAHFVSTSSETPMYCASVLAT